MSIKSDLWIRRMAEGQGMIEPFEPNQVKHAPDGHRIVSYGTSSYGYDVRCAREFKIFTNINSTIGAYAAARLAEAGGLWHGRNWARWLGLVSAGLYVPFELAYAVHRPGAASLGLLALNVAVLWLLWPPRAGADD